MTDRVKALTVILEKDIREDDIEYLVNAISCIRGVLRVKNIISTGEEFVQEERVRKKVKDKLYKLIDEL